MNIPLERAYGLVSRGGPGLACDEHGATLGPVDLARVGRDPAGVYRCETRSSFELAQILRTAYGPQPHNVVQRLCRGLRRVAAWIEAGDIGRAGVEAVMLGFPSLPPGAMAKLAEVADLEKAGVAWETQPRLPAGQTGAGQWTTDGGDGIVSPPTSGSRSRLALPLDDGVYRPGIDDPVLVPTGGGAAEDEEPRSGSNELPPPEVTNLQEVFPGLKDAPGLAIPLAPIDGFLGVSATANAANLSVTMMQYRFLIAQIKTLDPGFKDAEILPEGGIAGLSWRGRANLIASLRMQRAATLYRFNGDVRLLQVETLRFLQDAVDKAYAEGLEAYNTGRLQPRLSREEAIGNYIDGRIRSELRELFNSYGVIFGVGSNIRVNSRDYDTSGDASSYRVPDARLGDVSFDWTLALKTISNLQIRGFFNADSQPSAVVVVRPNQLGRNSTYAIPRPAEFRPRR